MNDLAALSRSELWENVRYHSRAAREFIHWLDRTHGPMGELIQAMSIHGPPKQLIMHTQALFAFERHLQVVDTWSEPTLSKYLRPSKFYKVILGIKVNTDDKLSCPVSPGRIVLDSIERYGINEITRPPC